VPAPSRQQYRRTACHACRQEEIWRQAGEKGCAKLMAALSAAYASGRRKRRFIGFRLMKRNNQVWRLKVASGLDLREQSGGAAMIAETRDKLKAQLMEALKR
jgi:hypothetical protein